jgi:hypothetical protein
MRALKILMAVMGVLIIAGVVFLGVTISQRIATPKLTTPSLIDEPAGTRIAQVASSGDHISLLLQGGGPDRVVVFDLRQGQIIGRTSLAR